MLLRSSKMGDDTPSHQSSPISLGYVADKHLPLGIYNWSISPLIKGEKPVYVQATDALTAIQQQFGDMVVSKTQRCGVYTIKLSTGHRYIVRRGVPNIILE